METFPYFKVSKFFLIASVLSVAIVTPSTLFPFIVGKYVWFRVCIDIALIATLLGIFLSKDSLSVISHKSLVILHHPLVIAVSIFTGVFLIAGFFGVDPHFSFWSNFERGEGGLQILHLFIFFLLSIFLFREEKDWRRILGWMLVGGVLMSLYGIFTGFGVNGFVGVQFTQPGFRFQGSIGNPAYVAAYALFAVFYVGYLVFSKYRKNLFSFIPVSLMILGIALFAVFISGATRGTFLGFLGAICVGGAYIAWQHKRWRKWLLSGIASLLVLMAIGVGFKNSSFIKKLPVARLFDISASTETFGDRAIMWKSAFEGWKARPILGWGPENFIHVFDTHFNTAYFKPPEAFGAWFDRAHSVIFDYLSETGIVGLLSYLSMFALFFILFFRLHRVDSVIGRQSLVIRAIILMFPVVYLIQGLVLFDVLPIYINIFLFLAFAVYQFQMKSKITNYKSQIILKS